MPFRRLSRELSASQRLFCVRAGDHITLQTALAVEGAGHGKRVLSVALGSKRSSAIDPTPPKGFGLAGGSGTFDGGATLAPALSDPSTGPVAACAPDTERSASLESTAGAAEWAHHDGAAHDAHADDNEDGDTFHDADAATEGGHEWDCEEADVVVNQTSVHDSYARFMPNACGSAGRDAKGHFGSEDGHLPPMEQVRCRIAELSKILHSHICCAHLLVASRAKCKLCVQKSHAENSSADTS